MELTGKNSKMPKSICVKITEHGTRHVYVPELDKSTRPSEVMFLLSTLGEAFLHFNELPNTQEAERIAQHAEMGGVDGTEEDINFSVVSFDIKLNKKARGFLKDTFVDIYQEIKTIPVREDISVTIMEVDPVDS